MRELQPPEGYSSTAGNLLSNAGHVVGWASGENDIQVRWEPDGSVTRLMALDSSSSPSPKAINDEGIIAGASHTPEGKSHAVTWDASGKPKRLEEPEGYLESWAEHINNRNVAVGTATRYHDIWAVRWDRDGKPTFLERPQYAIGSHATRINENGEIIGGARFGSGLGGAVRWDANGKVKYLAIDTLAQRAGAWDINNRGTVAGGAYDPSTHTWRAARALRCCIFRVMPGASEDSDLYDVNNRDVFLGSHKRADGVRETVRWENDRMVTMKPVPGTTSHSVAPMLNDAGLAVGSSDQHAAVWDASGNATLLPDEKPGQILKRSYALAINNAGQILGTADYWDVPKRAVIWS
ncbi:DUF3466 family protein [Streptomyces sp. LX-29]|uniref:hypothetical protein n=1 Tax=Streptomyces sp. LX-29 TaxID=2900152 RepID=UPI00240D6FBF|nr:hypothetical protein [Streptomyces sp. LX-29]WFB05672.1 DUF3466 family protein [Streptomyces sp. LX-29]